MSVISNKQSNFQSLLILVLAVFLVIISCHISALKQQYNNPRTPAGTGFIQPSPQRIGDPKKGIDYLLYGDYINAGVPCTAFKIFNGDTGDNLLERDGESASIPFNYNLTTAANGVKIVSPNCLQCHASKLNGKLIVGLGNTKVDFTKDRTQTLKLLSQGLQMIVGEDSEEWEAYLPFKKAVESVSPYLGTECVGVNHADQLAAALAAHRDKNTLEWYDDPLQELPAVLVPTDVPPWWVLKKKNAMFYTGSGRGDYASYLMVSSLLTLKDTMEANVVRQKFPDILAFLNELEPPPYPSKIDNNLTSLGKEAFSTNCSTCHGTYGPGGQYPNLLVSLEKVGTDPALSHRFQSADAAYYIDWFNTGWFSKGPYGTNLVAEGGYVAQPLDGIWSSATYLHNGSVPNLYALLNSSARPDYWKRDNSQEYDYEKIGIPFIEENESNSREVYNTSLPGYGNQGHYFGDNLSETQRIALIEYLKTL